MLVGTCSSVSTVYVHVSNTLYTLEYTCMYFTYTIETELPAGL